MCLKAKPNIYWHHMRNSSFALLLALGLLAALAVVACKGDSSPASTPSPTPDLMATATVTATPTPVLTPELREVTPLAPGCPTIETPGGAGLLSDLSFADDRTEYASGEPISATLTVINCDNEEVRLFYPDGQRYEFKVEDSDDQEIWLWSDAQTFEQSEGEETIMPGETVLYTGVWDQRSDGEQVSPGKYQIFGFSVGCADQAAIEDGCHFGAGLFVDIAR